MPIPDFFDHGNDERTQDAVICWLLKLSEMDVRNDDGELRNLGCDFINALVRKHDETMTVDPLNVEIHQQVTVYGDYPPNGRGRRRQYRIDVLARIHDRDGSRHVLVIEDKVDSGPHNDLGLYVQRVIEGETPLRDVDPVSIYPIYLKTGTNLSRGEETRAENLGYRIFDREDFFGVLGGYSGNDRIPLDFRNHLNGWQTEFTGYWNWSRDDDRTEWSWRAWEGFFRCLEDGYGEQLGLNGDECWGNVPKGGFLGFWWHWRDVPDEVLQAVLDGIARNRPYAGNIPGAQDFTATLYLQLQVTPGNPDPNPNPYFRLEVNRKNGIPLAELRTAFTALLGEAGDGRVAPPRYPGRGNTMAAATWNDEWLAWDAEGGIDIDGTVQNLTSAMEVIDVIVNRQDGR